MSTIDPTARVADGAVIGGGAVIGPYCIVGPDVVIGAQTRLIAHVNVAGRTTIGERCEIYPFASLGTPPHDLSYRGEPTQLFLGDDCIIREGTTMNVGTVKGGGVTRIGARGYFMNNAHVAHDCIVGNDVIFATSATLGGHCEVGDYVYMGGLSAAHQFTRIGSQVMVGGVSGISGDIIPYAIVNGQRATLRGLNLVGMKRRKFTRERIMAVRRFYRALFFGDGLFSDRLARVAPMAGDDPAIAEILQFIADGKHRALCMPKDNADA